MWLFQLILAAFSIGFARCKGAQVVPLIPKFLGVSPDLRVGPAQPPKGNRFTDMC